MTTDFRITRATGSGGFPAAGRGATRLALFCIFSLTLALAPFNLSASPLESGFATPPPGARPLTWWHWINGNVTKAGIEADLTAMRDAGIAGVQLFDASIYLPAGPVRYGSDEWHEHVQFALRTAARLGLDFSLMNTPGWSASGGPWITPDKSMKKLVWTETTIESDGSNPVAAALPRPSIKENFYRDIAVLAVPADPPGEKPVRLPDWQKKIKLASGSITRIPAGAASPSAIPRDKILNLTANTDASGNCRAALPAGRWTILRFGFTSTGAKNHPAVPEGHGLECDKLDPDAVAFQFERSVGRIIREAGPLAGKTLTGLLFDSFEAGFQNWTDTLPEQFRAAHRYDLIPLLPALTGRVIDSTVFTECVLNDFRELITASLAKNYFGTMQRLAREHGLIIYAEAQGGPLNPAVIEPYIDVVMNEFWHHSRFPARLKLCASIVNIHDKHILAAEAFSARPEEDGWAATLASLKRPGDHAFASGVNRVILHTYAHQPFSNNAPGFTLGRYGTRFNRLQTWWPAMPAWTAYIARSQFLLQQGWKHADILLLQNEDLGYAYPISEILRLPAGYDFDIAYPRDLDAMTVRDGALTLPHGPAYRVLVTPQTPWAADLATLRRLRDYVRAGLVINGNPPVAPAGLRDLYQKNEYDTLVAEIWGDVDGKGIREKKLGRGLVTRGITPADALARAKLIPDLDWPGSGAPRNASDDGINYIHRRTRDGADIYFVFNHTGKPLDASFTFRASGRRPELWDAVAGTRADAPVFNSDGNVTRVALQLASYGSTFVVFQKSIDANSGIANNRPNQITSALPLDPPWQVIFQNTALGVPATPVVFERLTSWSEHPDDAIRHYSGSASYSKTFNLDEIPSGLAAFLDLGDVRDLAMVRLNGRDVTTLWTPPFRANITAFLRPGENRLEIRVINAWVNRLIGDERIPIDYEYQKQGVSKFTDGRLLELPAWLAGATGAQKNPRHTFSTWKHHTADSPLLPAGLLGPVRMEWLREIQ